MDKTALKAFFGCVLLLAVVFVFRPKHRQSLKSDLVPGTSAEEVVEDLNEDPQDEALNLEKTPQEKTAVTAAPMNIDAMIKQVQENLPQNGRMKIESEEDYHHTNPAILRAGEEMGHLKEIWMKSPQERPKALAFYEQCTFDQSLVESVRALCYMNAIEVSVYLNRTEKVLAWNIDRSVQDLANRLMAN